jgi:tRNA(fMet)-specific endonuclease VapC
MALRYLLDTNICIYISKEKPRSVLERFESINSGDIAMSLVTYAELLFGAEKSNASEKSKKILLELTTLIPPLPLSLEVAGYYAKIRSFLERKGNIIGNNDLWIASHALTLKTILVTNNTKEFSRVPNLRIENWI